MKIEVRLFAVFREGRFNRKEMEFPEGSSPDDVLDNLKIAREHVGILLVNGRGVADDYQLTSNDVMAVFPSLGGG